MLEDLDSIDLILQETGEWVKFVIIDSGETRAHDPDKHLHLLNHKIDCCLAYLCDDCKFDELGRPQDIVFEVRCAYPVRSSTPLTRTATCDKGRNLHYKIVFVERLQ